MFLNLTGKRDANSIDMVLHDNKTYVKEKN